MCTRLTISLAMFPLLSSLAASLGRAAEKVPILYSTDLHHPHMDPDDHFDLATLFAMPEFDVRGIVLDCGGHQQKAPGEIPVGQILHLTRRKVPYAIGLGKPLRRATDDGRDQPGEFQRGVRLILDALRESPEKLTVFTTGSLRDVAAAFNREPELLRRKIGRLYINIGNPAIEKESRRYEYNVNLDRHAYVCVMRSGLPIYWCPCFHGTIRERGVHGTYWKFDQRRVLETAPKGLQNWFIFALTKPQNADPIAFLSAPQDPAARTKVWKMSRNMWCTAPFLHAAGRRVYLRSHRDYVALPSLEAQQSGLSEKEVNVFDFVPMRVTVQGDSGGTVSVDFETDAAEPNGYVFQSIWTDYDQILTACLKNLLADFEE
ncbi:nucleoside hydrolase [Planctomycetota bacterium]